MLTLAFAQLLYAVAFKWTSVTGASDALAGIPRQAGPFGITVFQTKTGYYYWYWFVGWGPMRFAIPWFDRRCRGAAGDPRGIG